MNFFKIIFSWWNSQTFGTFLNTLFLGEKVGQDEFGNTYYKNKKDSKRWVIYNGEVDASKIPPEWHAWIHKLIKVIPSNSKFNNFAWQKSHQQNFTGTKKAYLPKNQKKALYKKWHPES